MSLASTLPGGIDVDLPLQFQRQWAAEWRWHDAHYQQLAASDNPADRAAAAMNLQRIAGLQQRAAYLSGDVDHLEAVSGMPIPTSHDDPAAPSPQLQNAAAGVGLLAGAVALWAAMRGKR